MTVKSARSPSRRFRFTQRFLESIRTPAERTTYLDARTSGLGLLVQPSGFRSFFWFRKFQGRALWHTIGAFPDLNLDEARALAEEANGKRARGEAPWKNGNPVTVGEVFDSYIEKHLRAHAKDPERAAGVAKSHLDCSRLRERRLDTVTKTEVRDLHIRTEKRAGKYAANRMMQSLRAAFNFAIADGAFVGANPAAKIKLYRETKRTRYLKPDEMPAFFRALRKEGNLDLRDFLWTALFAGQRRGSTLAMRWDELDLERGLWTIPDPKNREPQTVVLVPEVVACLKARRRRIRPEVEWVFPSSSKAGHLLSLKNSWQRFRGKVGISDVWVHDLRRSLGSWEAGSGTSLLIIGKSLGHRSPAATAVYAQLDTDPIRASVTRATRLMLTAGKKGKRA